MCDLSAGFTGHVPLHCIVPPFLLRVIALRGDADTAAMARDLLIHDRELREARARVDHTAFQTGDPAAPGLLAGRMDAPAARVRRLERVIYDGGNRAELPGTAVRREGEPATGDVDADLAYDGSGAVYDLYFEGFERDSIDGEGMPLVSTVNHRRGYNNAFWDGKQMVFGNGDGQIFRTFTELSIIGHEMSHGVVQFSGGLIYRGQSGALNESFADVFGALTTQRMRGETAVEADWLIGRAMFAPDIKGVALRSMKMPGTAYDDPVLGQDPQPYHMSFYVDTTDDEGGVHINSGIPNHAFYLYCMYQGGRAWEGPGRIWYHALQALNNPMASFHDWAAQTVKSAMEMHGIGAPEVVSLRRAWTLVGLPV